MVYVLVLPVTICTLGIGIHRAANQPTVADHQVGLWQSKSSIWLTVFVAWYAWKVLSNSCTFFAYILYESENS
jgi:hypothetical protein